MKLITSDIQQALTQNHGKELRDIQPVMRLFAIWSSNTMLVISMEPDGDTLMAICDLSVGHVEYGPVSLREIVSITGPGGLKIERDQYWAPEHDAQTYLENGRAANRLVPKLK